VSTLQGATYRSRQRDPKLKKNEADGKRTLLDVVVRKRATVLELLSSKDQSLLVRGDSLLVLNL
jgi:hypothetical protein